MRIPLDYYRILGLPVQTSGEQLQQAYRDRTLQLPRREYSGAAIEARKGIIEQAYVVLSNPEQRAQYDANYFAHAYEREEADSITDPNTANPPKSFPTAVDSYTPSIEIADELFVGVLLILQELGEYELVLNLGRPYLREGTLTGAIGREKPELVKSDIILTLALACLELGREQWQQAQYESAASSLENGKDLLSQTQLFSGIESEIEAELDKLRPYRILELLSRPENNITERRQGLKLLQDILEHRSGIDGTAEDGSGLSVDDFLRFIQQLRSYLTVSEQQSLFAVESQRPSAVASYLQVYVLIARGFAHRMPVLIRQAKLLLTRLGKRQDLYLEQAICSLLLGQTTEASQALELSREYEAIAFIQENSQGSPDLLPGLCLYSERWLRTDVFPHFRDLAGQQASLKDYFADEQVQAYLEALPTQLEPVDDWATASQLATTNDHASSSSHTSDLYPTRSLATTTSKQHPPNTQSITIIDHRDTGESTDFLSLSDSRAQTGVAVVPAPERRVRTPKNQSSLASAPNTVQTPSRSRRRTRNRVAREASQSPSRQGRTTLAANAFRARKTRLLLLLLASMLGVLTLGFLASQVFGLLRQALFPAPSLQGEQLLVQLDQPPIPIPNPTTKALTTPQPLNQETAKQVIQSWLSTKSAAFGSNHAIDQLEQVLVGPTLLQWQQLAQRDKADNRYRQFKHSLTVNSVQTKLTNLDQAQVEARVHEVAQIYEDGKLNQNSSYDENLRIRYGLVRKNGQWQIRGMTILR